MEPDRRRLLLDAYKRRAMTYDRGLALAERLRLWPRTHQKAVARLSLQPGDVVLDVGCGTGLSFPFIEARIGSEGRLVGLDLSPDMLAKARERVESSGWQNVTLIESAIEEADIPFEVDAVLFHFVGEILRSHQALENIFQHVKPGGRVAAAGTKRAPWWVFPLNLYVWFVARRYGRPRAHLVRFVPDLAVEPVLLGGVYIAWGTVPRE